jgi:hypothetical protein
MASPEVLTVISLIAAVFGAGIVGIMALRFTHFDKEAKALRDAVVKKQAKLDELLENEIKNPQTTSKKTIKGLVAEMSTCETRINALDDIRKSLKSNFRFDWVVLVVLALIPASAYAINPIETAYPAMFALALIVAFHIAMFVSRVFELQGIESLIESEEEAQRKKAMGD